MATLALVDLKTSFETFQYSALQLHFIKCPFPNQIQIGLEKNLQIIEEHFQTKPSLVWKIIVSNFEGKIPNQIQFGLGKKC